MSHQVNQKVITEAVLQALINAFVIEQKEKCTIDKTLYSKDDFLRDAFNFAVSHTGIKTRRELSDLLKLLRFYSTDLNKLGLNIELLTDFNQANTDSETCLVVSPSFNGIKAMPLSMRTRFIDDDKGLRHAGLATSLFLVAELIRNKRVKLNMKDCWTLLGFNTAISTDEKLKYNQANSLSKRAANIYNIIEVTEGREWDNFSRTVLQIDFETLDKCQYFRSVLQSAKKYNIELTNGRDVEVLLSVISGVKLPQQKPRCASLFNGKLEKPEEKQILAKIEFMLSIGDDFCQKLLEKADASPYYIIHELLNERLKLKQKI